VKRSWLGAAGGERLCASALSAVGAWPLDFTVRSHVGRLRVA
jgi:hypothetical protein